MSSHEVVENGGDSSRGRGGRPIRNRVFASVDALAQISSFPNSLEYGPIGPCPDSEAVFVAAQAVIQHEGSCPCRGDADTKPPRCLRALDRGPRKIGDAVALVGERQPLDRFLAEFPVCRSEEHTSELQS